MLVVKESYCQLKKYTISQVCQNVITNSFVEFQSFQILKLT